MSSRREALDAAKALGTPAIWDRDALMILGRAVLVSTSDEGEEGEMTAMIDEADAWLAKTAAASASVKTDVPSTTAIRAWLLDPRGPWSTALRELDALGKLSAALSTVSPNADVTSKVDAEVRSLTQEITECARLHAPLMLDAAIAASERISSEGVAPGPDDALIALSDVVGLRLEAALRGEALDPPVKMRAKALSADVANDLSAMLAKALRKPSLDLAPDMLELSFSPNTAPSMRSDVVLHEATPTTARDLLPLELARGVKIVFRGEDLEVSLDAAKEAPMLVPISHGEPGKPCRARGGADHHETIFDLSEGGDIDGYALVVGDRVVFLRRKLRERFVHGARDPGIADGRSWDRGQNERAPMTRTPFRCFGSYEGLRRSCCRASTR